MTCRPELDLDLAGVDQLPDRATSIPWSDGSRSLADGRGRAVTCLEASRPHVRGSVMSQLGRLRHLHGMEGAVSVSAGSEAASRVESAFFANERRLGQFLVQMVRDRALAEDLLQETFE